jgi:hypothetical protein
MRSTHKLALHRLCIMRNNSRQKSQYDVIEFPESVEQSLHRGIATISVRLTDGISITLYRSACG